MSSTYVRTQIKNFIQTKLPSENLIDLTAMYSTLDNMIADAGVGDDDPWLGLTFIADEDEIYEIPTNNASGKYREVGVIMLHFVDIAKLAVGDSIVARAEAAKNAFRGQRINDILIDSITPVNFDRGATLDFDGGYISGSIMLAYRRDESI